MSEPLFDLESRILNFLRQIGVIEHKEKVTETLPLPTPEETAQPDTTRPPEKEPKAPALPVESEHSDIIQLLSPIQKDQAPHLDPRKSVPK